MIVSGGENVFPKEVEDCLSRHENVQDVAAIGVDDDDYGKRLRAFVVKDGDVDEDTLKAHVKDNLARYKVPREIVFLDELPRNATGKVLKKDLKEYDEDGDPGESLRAGGLDESRDSTGGRGWHDGGMTLAIGDPAPDFTLKDQHGQDITLSSYAGSKAVAARLLPVRLQWCLHRRAHRLPRPARRLRDRRHHR